MPTTRKSGSLEDSKCKCLMGFIDTIPETHSKSGLFIVLPSLSAHADTHTLTVDKVRRGLLIFENTRKLKKKKRLKLKDNEC